jgi:hypothetical protein
MRNPIIRTIYLYLFALVGLGMLVIGSAMLINLGLKAWVFTKADEQDIYMSQPAPLYLDKAPNDAKALQVCSDKCLLTAMEKEQINNWLIDYETWQAQEKNRNPNDWTVRNRQRQGATAISLILIGLPLWLFHWATIKRDLRDKKEEV